MERLKKFLKERSVITVTERDIPGMLTDRIRKEGDIRFDGSVPYIDLGSYWQKISKEELRTIIRNRISSEDRSRIKSSVFSEVATRLSEDITLKVDFEASRAEQEHLINFRNGVLNIKTGEFTTDRSKWLFDYYVDADYIADCSLKDCPQFMKFIESSAGIENKDCILRAFGYAISSLLGVRVAVFFVGETSGGKSTALRLLESGFASELISHLNFQQLGDRHYVIRLLGKKLNISYDNSGKALDNEEIFKSVVACETIEGRALRENPVEFRPRAKLFYASNKPFVFKHPDLALYRRMVVVPFERSVPPEKQDKHLLEKLVAEKNVIFSLAARSLKGFIEAGYDFKMSKQGQAYIESRITALHSGVDFLADRTVLDPNGTVSVAILYDSYRQWCTDNALDPDEKAEFKETVLSVAPTVEFRKVGPTEKRVWGYHGVRLKTTEELFAPAKEN